MTIQAVTETHQWTTVYNLRVADWHTYFVGCDEWGFSVWAHNQYWAEAIPDGSGYRVLDKRTGKYIESSPGQPKVFTKREAYIEAQAKNDSLIAHAKSFIATNPTSVPRPHVTDPELKKIIDRTYKGETYKGKYGKVGTGSTADALRFEKMTGMDFDGQIHGKAASEIINRLQKWLRDHPQASAADIAVAKAVIADLQDALNFTPVKP